MPECWVRYHVPTGELFEAQFRRKITSGVGPEEAVVSVGSREQIPDPRLERMAAPGVLRPATAEEQQAWEAQQPSARRRAKLKTLEAAQSVPELKQAILDLLKEG